MLTRRSFLPSFFGGAAAALVPAAALAIPTEKTGYQRLTVGLGGATRDYCVRLTESQLPEYQAWLMGLCASATIIKSVDDPNPENALTLAETKAAVSKQDDDCWLIDDEDGEGFDEVTCSRCGWSDYPDTDGTCYNCG